MAGTEADAHDLMQETVLRAVVNKQKFIAAKNRKSWMFKVALNIFRDRCRAELRHGIHQLSVDIPEHNVDPIKGLQLVEEKDRIMLQFEKLPPVQRQIMFLRCVEEYTVGEIADHLDTNVSNVKASLSIARKKLRHLLRLEEVETDQ